MVPHPVSDLLDCYAIAHPGAEAVTAAELAALGLAPGATEPGGVEFRTDLEGVWRANLELRTAARVLVRVAEFRASAFAELERRANRVPWGDWLAPGAAVRFRVTSRKSRLYHQDAVAERLHAAVARAVSGTHVAPPSAAPAASGDDDGGADVGQLFVVRLFRDRCTVSVDSSGELLHRRGYRLAVAKAPLRETLAAAMLLGAGWDGGAPLVDPFCGSGTIPIEAALLARRIPPGLHRAFAFERWPGFDAVRWNALRATARAAIRAVAGVPILGADRDPGAIRAATSNAERAGVAADVTFRRAPLSALEPPDPASEASRDPSAEAPGWLVTNPPYGVRVGERHRVRDLYAQLGHVARRRLPGWRVAFLSTHPELEAQTGLALAPRWLTSNGGIRVRLVSGTVGAPILQES
jgi:putative N6-adenine-specific DNA methylase